MLLYLKEIKFDKKSFIIWALILFLMINASMAMFPSFSSDGDKMTDLMNQFPEEMLKALNAVNLDFTNPHEYISYMYLYIMLISCLFVMLQAGNTLAAEESEGTIEFLYAKPITRTEIVMQKILAIITQMVLMFVINLAAFFSAFSMFAGGDFDGDLLILLSLGLFMGQVFFLGIGIFISSFMRKSKIVMPVALGITVMTMFLSMISGIVPSVEFLKYVTPFKYFDSLLIVRTGEIDLGFMALSAAVCLVGIVIGTIKYNQKDIHV